MAVVNSKSTIITNSDSTPNVLTPRGIAGMYLYSAIALNAVAAADDDTSVYRAVRIPSNAILRHIWRKNDAITGGTSYNLGVYRTAFDGGAVVSATVLGTAIDLSSASVVPVDNLNEALNINTAEKRLWEVLGLSVDPGVLYDICWTGATVGTGAGNIVTEVVWAI